MNKDKPQLPEDYIPFGELIICSNHLISVKVPIEFKNNIPLLIGKGDVPLIWLSAPITKEEKDWRKIVIKNKPMDKKITVIPSEAHKSITIKAGDKTIIQVIRHSDEKAEVIMLDLKPLGFNIYGDANILHFGTNKFINNSFENLWAMIGVG